jgi:DNA-binding NtrC family response regulator
MLDAGASDVLNAGRFEETVVHVAARLTRWREIEAATVAPCVQQRCVGSSRSWRSVLRRVAEAGLSGSMPVLVTGESGSGKEVVARLIHELDRRPDKRGLVTVDCTTIVRELSGSELFGHVKGAFTGAQNDRLGAFALANDGTLFLDEIGELSLPLQAELLRVVQEGTFKPVGSNAWSVGRFRLVAATHRNLERDVAEGRFRHDLYHRLAGWRISLPALRERIEDIPLLAQAFVREFATTTPPPALAPEVSDFLMSHAFPGNVRQLRSVVMRAMLRYPGSGPVTLGLIAPEDRPRPPPNEVLSWHRDLEGAAERAVVSGVPLKDITKQVSDCVIRLVVRNESGSLQRAAKRLGVTDRALQLRIAAQRPGLRAAKAREDA